MKLLIFKLIGFTIQKNVTETLVIRGGTRAVLGLTYSGSVRVGGLSKPFPKHNPFINRVKKLSLTQTCLTGVTRL